MNALPYIEQDTPLTDICTRNVVSLRPENNIGDAASLMSSKGISSLLVTDEQMHPLGIITERNILHAMQSGRSADSSVQTEMSSPVITVHKSTSCLDAYHICMRKGIRHLVIVDDDNRTFGIVSETDFRVHINPVTTQGQKQIATIMTHSVFCVTPQTLLQEALNMMQEHEETCVVVIHDHRPAGILTERDVVRLYTSHTDQTSISVSAVMTSPVLTTSQSSTISQAAELMRSTRIRHLVAIDENGCVSGMITEHELTSAMSLDLMDRKEQALRQQLSFARALNRISRLIVEQSQPDLTLQGTTKIINEILQTDRTLLYEISFSKRHARGIYISSDAMFGRELPETYPLDDFIDSITEMQNTHRWIISQRKQINPIFQRDGSAQILHEQLKIESLLWYPFCFNDDGYYLLAINQIHSQREWTHSELDFLDSVSQLISVALEKIQFLDERERAANDLRIAAIAFESHEAMMITDANNTIVKVNQAFTDVTGYKAEDVIGKNPKILSSDRQDDKDYKLMWECINSAGKWTGEIWNKRKNGDLFPVQITITAVKDEAGNTVNYVGSFSDISDRKIAEEAIRELAFFDPLTKLPNRRLLHDRLQQAIESSARSGKHGALLYLDLDHFKKLNDSLGHEMGDLLLKYIAERLQESVRKGDSISRIGGDEFVIVLENLSEHGVDAAEQTEIVLATILQSMEKSCLLADHEYRVSISIGVTLFKDHQRNLDTLLRQADIAMYQAKRAGRNAYRFFNHELQVNQQLSFGDL